MKSLNLKQLFSIGLFSALATLPSIDANAQILSAQESYSEAAKTLPLDKIAPGYSPTVFSSKDEVMKLWDIMPWSEFKPGDRRFNPSQCYMRAQLWGYDFYRNHQVNAMKVFVFYTHTFKRWYENWAKANKKKDKKFDWWYHVAPYVLLKDPASQSLQEWVLDPSFAFMLGGSDPKSTDRPLNMKEWTDLFVESKRACKEFVRYQDFQCEVESASQDCPKIQYGTEHCYIIRTPAPVYNPDEIAELHSGSRKGYSWDYKNTTESLEKAPAGLKNENFWRKRIGFPTK